MSGDQMRVAVARLCEAARGAGLDAPRSAVDPEGAIDAVARAVAPLRVPSEVETLWRLLRPETINPMPYPRLSSPEFDLDGWRMHARENPGMTPRLLFPVAYESWGFLFVELGDGQRLGGAIFSWGYGGEDFVLTYHSLTEYILQLAESYECGQVEREPLPDGRIWYHLDSQVFDKRAHELLGHAPGQPDPDQVTRVEEPILRWPAHWLAAEGPAAQDRYPRGRTASIAELTAAAAHAPTHGVIHGRVISLAGTSAGSRVAVDDGTGVLDVWCAAEVCVFGPILTERFEFDVVVSSTKPPPDTGTILREADAAASQGDVAAAQDAIMARYHDIFQTPAAAQALAVRPLPLD